MSTAETSAVIHDPSLPPAIRLSLSNLAALVALFTDPGTRRGALTLRDGTVVEVIPDAERYGADPRPSLEPDAVAIRFALMRLRASRTAAEANRELDRAFLSMQVATMAQVAAKKNL